MDFCSAIKDTRRFNYVVRVSPVLCSACFAVVVSISYVVSSGEGEKVKSVCRLRLVINALQTALSVITPNPAAKARTVTVSRAVLT